MRGRRRSWVPTGACRAHSWRSNAPSPVRRSALPNGVGAVPEDFRFDDRCKPRLLAQGGISRERMSVRLDAVGRGDPIADGDDCTPLGEARSQCDVLRQPLLSPSRPSVIFSPGNSARALTPRSTLIPGTIPRRERISGKGVPSEAFYRRVSSKRITPLMKSWTPGVVNSSSR